MYQRHIDYIKEQKDNIFQGGPLGQNWINENYQHHFLENIWQFSFKQMYPNIMLQMDKHNLIQLDNQDKIREAILIDDIKIRNNTLYGILHRQDKMIFHLTKVYTEAIYKEILEDHTDKMIQIETDVFYTKELFDISKYCTLEYEVENIDLAYFFRKKQYFKQIGTDLKFYGFTKSQSESMSEFKSELREYKLSKLFKNDDIHEK